MLAAIRTFAKSWVAAVLIGLLVVSFAVFGISDVSPWMSLAVVGGATVVVSLIALQLLRSGYKIRS